MYSRILVAIDGSRGSSHALQHAAGLARGLAATLRIIHVVDIGLLPYGPELSFDVDALLKARYAAGEKILAEALDNVRDSGLDVEARLQDATAPTVHVAAAIADAAASWPADLVVLGTHGRRGVERWLLGSVAEGTARRSSVPILLVPTPSA